MFLFDTEFKLMWCLLGLSKVSSQKRFGIICYVTMGIPLRSQIPRQFKELETILIENAFLFTLLSLENHFFSYFDPKAEDSPISCDITTGCILKGVSYFIGLECYEPDGPDGGTKQCNEFGGSKFCTVTCNSGSQLYRETAFYWQCNKGVWTPSDVIPDCVGKTNPDKPHQ